MKNINKISIIIILLFTLSVNAETLNFITDRYLYVSNETVQLYGKIKTNQNERASTIVYADIISPDFEVVSTTKLISSNTYFKGQLKIPDYIKTSVYIIRVYTKFMRNSHIKYSYLKIVNPNSSEVLKADNISNINLLKINNNLHLNIRQNKRSYQKLEKVNISGKIDKNAYLLLTPAGLESKYPVFDYSTKNIELKTFEKEINSFNISGQCVSNKDTAKFNKVNFSILGEKYYQSVYTDSLGNFTINTFYYNGEKQLYFYAEDAKVMVDNDFAVINRNLKFPEFDLSDSEKILLLNLINNSKIASQYLKFVDLKGINDDYDAFYGQVDEELYLHVYVDMDLLTDYFNEIPGLVNVENTDSEYPVFKIRSKDPKIGYYRPLVMVNFMQINSNRKILDVRPELISKVEIINSVYIRDDFYYGGIINFITKDGKFDNSVLPENSVIVNYKFIDVNNKISNINDYPFAINSYSKDIKNDFEIEFIAPKDDVILKLFYFDENAELQYFDRKIRIID